MLYYTDHARQRMLERGITKKDVEYCLSHYHTSHPDREGNRVYRADLTGTRRLKVVVKTIDASSSLVITAADY
jgi:hypothetical protein